MHKNVHLANGRRIGHSPMLKHRYGPRSVQSARDNQFVLGLKWIVNGKTRSA